MAIAGLKIIGESINDSVPSTSRLFAAGDVDGILELARAQDQRGADYIDVNVGRRSPDFMADLVGRIRGVTDKPPAIDTPDLEIARRGLEACRGGREVTPILNSVSPLRLEFFDLHRAHACMPILMVSEHAEAGTARPNKTGAETYETARFMLDQARQRIPGITNDQCIIDPGIAPIGSDTEGNLKRLLDAMRLISADTDFAGVHFSVGLSNFTVMLPSRRPDGMPVKSALESAFLTLARPLGLDMVVGSTLRKYTLLDDDHPAMACLRDILELEGFDAIARVQEFYAPA